MRHAKFHLGWSLLLVGAAFPAAAAVSAHPGTINFVEGEVLIDGKSVPAGSSTDLKPGSTLRTNTGRAEVLLTPGVFLRLGHNSEARLTSASLTDTRVSIDRGIAMVEATNVEKENRIQVSDPRLTSVLKKNGLYRFDSERSAVSVFDGKLDVRQEDKTVELKKNKEAVAGETELTVEKFDSKDAKETDTLYQWSKLRSKYLSEASESAAQRIIVQPGGWYGTGWYWSPWLRGYTWLPGRDPFFSPFGYGYYSPWSSWRPMYVGPQYRVRPWSGPRWRSGSGVHRGIQRGSPGVRGGSARGGRGR